MAFLGLAGCTTAGTVLPFGSAKVTRVPGQEGMDVGEFAYYAAMYAARPDEKFPLPSVPFERIDPIYYRRLVDDRLDHQTASAGHGGFQPKMMERCYGGE